MNNKTSALAKKSKNPPKAINLVYANGLPLGSWLTMDKEKKKVEARKHLTHASVFHHPLAKCSRCLNLNGGLCIKDRASYFQTA